MPARPKRPSEVPSVSTEENELPNLNSDTLLNLTEKIRNNLKKTPTERTRTAPVVKSNNGRQKDGQSSQKLELQVKPARPPTIVEGRSNGKTKLVGKKPLQIPKPQLGKKRLRDGQVKGLSHSRSDVNSVKLGVKAAKTPKESFNIEEEILALGGTKDDYELIEGALSDSEIESNEVDPTKASRSDLQKDLARLVKELGVEKAHVEEAKRYSSQDLAEDYAEGDHVSSSTDVPALIPKNEERLTTLSTKASGRGLNHLVCYLFFKTYVNLPSYSL